MCGSKDRKEAAGGRGQQLQKLSKGQEKCCNRDRKKTLVGITNSRQRNKAASKKLAAHAETGWGATKEGSGPAEKVERDRLQRNFP